MLDIDSEWKGYIENLKTRILAWSALAVCAAAAPQSLVNRQAPPQQPAEDVERASQACADGTLLVHVNLPTG